MKSGRPTKATPEMIDRLCDCLNAGMSKQETAAALGISRNALYKWMAQPQVARRVASIPARAFSLENTKVREGLVIAAIHRGCWTKSDIQGWTGFSEWVTRVTLDKLQKEKLVIVRRQSAAGAVNPLLYKLA